LYSTTALSGYGSCTQTLLNVTMNSSGNNQFSSSSFKYDGAGNMLWDGLYSYTYDAEGHQASAAGVNYVYDGDGQRVEKANGTIYWYGMGGEVLTESALDGTSPVDYIYFGGRRLARVTSSTVYYYFGDHLDSARVMVQAGSSTACYEGDFEPYGREHVVTGTCSQHYKFTGKERDAETQNDYFPARFLESNLGRWLSPDPGGVNAVHLDDPQTWNMYAYVRNNPATLNDPTGLMEADTVSYIHGTPLSASCQKMFTCFRVTDEPGPQPVPAQIQQGGTPAQAFETSVARRDDLIAVRSPTKVESALPFYAIFADVQYTIVQANSLELQAKPEGVQLREELAPGADSSVAKELVHGKNPVERSNSLTDAVDITPHLMKQTFALRQQILVGGEAVRIFDRNSSGGLTGGRWVNVQSVIQGKFFYQGTEWKPGNTY
jgi:RHS repeat-associated protein